MNLKDFHIIGMLLISHLTADGQVKIQNTSLINPDTSLVYVGVDNLLRITGIKNMAHLKFSINDVEKKLEKNGSFYLRPPSESSIYQIKLSVGSKLLTEKTYQSRIILDPKVGLGTKYFADTALSIPEIVANNKLLIHIPSCLFHFYMQVHRFDFTIYSGDKMIYSINVNGNSLSHIELDLIKNLKGGDKITFENIRASGPEDTRIKTVLFIIDVK